MLAEPTEDFDQLEAPSQRCYRKQAQCCPPQTPRQPVVLGSFVAIGRVCCNKTAGHLEIILCDTDIYRTIERRSWWLPQQHWRKQDIELSVIQLEWRHRNTVLVVAVVEAAMVVFKNASEGADR